MSTTQAKLVRFQQAYRLYLKAVRANDPFIASHVPPKPEDYGLAHQPERSVALSLAERMEKEK